MRTLGISGVLSIGEMTYIIYGHIEEYVDDISRDSDEKKSQSIFRPDFPQKL